MPDRVLGRTVTLRKEDIVSAIHNFAAGEEADVYKA